MIFVMILGGYRYIFLPYERVTSLEGDVRREMERIKHYESRLKTLEEKRIEATPEGEKVTEERYFSGIQAFKEGIGKLLKEKNLEIVEIASGEKEGERIYYSYHIEGDEKDMHSFLSEVEKRDGAFTLVNAPIKMERDRLMVKIGGYFKFKEEIQRESYGDGREKVFSSGGIESEFYPLGTEKGIVILKGSGRIPRRILVEKEMEVEYYGERYNLKIKNGGLRIE